jgi:hypothetical protein
MFGSLYETYNNEAKNLVNEFQERDMFTTRAFKASLQGNVANFAILPKREGAVA